MDGELREAVIRLEGKVDSLGARVGGEMSAMSKHMDTLVEMLKLQLTNTQHDVTDLKSGLAAERVTAANEVSTARVDLERQLNEHKLQNERDSDDAKADRARLVQAVDALNRFVASQATTNKVVAAIGGVALAGVGGLVFQALGGG